MKLLFILTTIVIGTIAFFVFQKDQQPAITNSVSQTLVSSPTPAAQEKIDISASFTVVTNGLTRDFTNSRYHNLSPNVYIESKSPSKVLVTKKGTTWDDFFKTLPMEVTKECLTTGTQQTFCTGDAGTLRFYLNDKEDTDLLDREINNGDKILIEFSNN